MRRSPLLSMEKLVTVQEVQIREQAIRMVLRQMRKNFKKDGRYVGTKLESMDRFEVKLSELPPFPVVLRGGVMDMAGKNAPKDYRSYKETRKRRKKAQD